MSKTNTDGTESARAIPSQGDRFIKTARHLGADEDEAAFKEKLAVIAQQKPKDEPDPPTRKK